MRKKIHGLFQELHSLSAFSTLHREVSKY